jgi:hypothetical protein
LLNFLKTIIFEFFVRQVVLLHSLGSTLVDYCVLFISLVFHIFLLLPNIDACAFGEVGTYIPCLNKPFSSYSSRDSGQVDLSGLQMGFFGQASLVIGSVLDLDLGSIVVDLLIMSRRLGAWIQKRRSGVCIHRSCSWVHRA